MPERYSTETEEEGMKHIGRISCLILTFLLCMIIGTAAADGAVRMPVQLQEIRAEAFLGDTALKKVIIPESVHTIGERAFAYSAVKQIVLPPSLTDVAANAFEGCKGIVAVVYAGSYAHTYCEENDIPYAFDPSNLAYVITALETKGREFLAAATTENACVLQVEVLSEDKQTVLYTVQGEAQEALDMTQVALEIPAEVTLPEYYVLRAVLLSEEGYPLCNAFTTIQYTAAFDAFEKLEPDDFEESVTISFGSGGFGVLEEGAIVIPGTSRKTDGGYVIPTSVVPEKGTVLLLTFSDGTQEPIKVEKAQDNGDGTVTVQNDPDVTLSELFDVFKYENVIDVGSAAQGRSRSAGGVGDSSDGSASLTTGYTCGPLSISVTGTASIFFKTFYDEKLFGDEFVELQCYIDLSAEVKATMSGGVNSDELKNDFGSHEDQPKITLYKGPIVIPDTGIVALQLEVSIPLDFTIEAEGVYTMTLTSKTGLKYTPENGIVPIKEKSTESSFEIKGKFMVKTGPKIELSVIFLHSILEASVSGQMGLKATGEAVVPVADAHTAPKEHACLLCCDMDISFFADVKGGVVANISENRRQTLVGVEILNLNYHLAKAYFSVINEKDSIFKGDPAFDWGECPNYKYRTYIRTRNRDAEEISGVPLTLLKGGKLYESAESPLKIYLYDGDYKVQAAFESGVGEESFEVLRNNQTIYLMEQYMQLSGTVTDAGTGEPAEGAQVTVMLPEGDPLITTTGSDGRYSFIFDPVESFQLSITKDYYMTWTRNITPGAEERKIVIDAQLVPGIYTVRFDAGGGSGEMTEFTAYAGEGFTLPECGFTAPEGKEFYFWEIDGESYAPGDKYDSASGDVTVTAMWKAYVPSHRYQAFDVHTDWVGAREYCASLGGHLATITSQEEQNKVVQAIINAGGGQSAYWLGGTDQSDEGDWRWITGEAWSYSQWGMGQPDNFEANSYYNPTGQKDEDYLALARGDQSWASDTHWNDFANNWSQYVSFGFICEWD